MSAVEIHAKSVTMRYCDLNDRIRLLCLDLEDRLVDVWLTRRFLNVFLKRLESWLGGTTLTSLQRSSAEHQMARDQVPLTAEPSLEGSAELSFLLSSISLSRQRSGLVLRMSDENKEHLVHLPLTEMQLHRVADHLYQLATQADWGLQQPFQALPLFRTERSDARVLN